MRRNLLWLILLFVLVALGYRYGRAPRPEKIEWEASFWLRKPNGFGADWLEMENDRFRICTTGCTCARVEDRGRVNRSGNQLELVSNSGKHRSYMLKESPAGRTLRDSSGEVYAERFAQIRRLHPEPGWLRADQALELDGVRPGMGRAEVLQRLPEARPDESGALVDYPYAESHNQRVTVALDQAGRIRLIRGICLSQGGRPLLNQCSTRSDVECLFGRLKWSSDAPDSFGCAATAQYGKLKIEVHSLLEMRYEEARLVGLTLAQ